jgi:hypothetical protein
LKEGYPYRRNSISGKFYMEKGAKIRPKIGHDAGSGLSLRLGMTFFQISYIGE